MAAATQIFQLPLQYSVSSGQRSYHGVCLPSPVVFRRSSGQRKSRRFGSLITQQEKGDAVEIRVPVPLTLEQQGKEKEDRDDEDEVEEGEVDPQDLKYVNEIKRVCYSLSFFFFFLLKL